MSVAARYGGRRGNSAGEEGKSNTVLILLLVCLALVVVAAASVGLYFGLKKSTPAAPAAAAAASPANQNQTASVEKTKPGKKPGAGETDPAPAPPGGWMKAAQTWFESYPTSSKEGSDFNGDQWAGKFEDGSKLSPAEVKQHNIVSFYNSNFQQNCHGECPWWHKNVKGKSIWIRNPETGLTLKAEARDTCSDGDVKYEADNCTSNAHKETGILIDIEKNTAQRFFGSGKIKDQSELEWKWA